MNETIQYYNDHAELFYKDTNYVDMSEAQNAFLKCIPKGGLILDLGCGSGRDSKAFIEAGYSVEAVDGSQALCEAASMLHHIPVIQMQFDELCIKNKYDGIWACASLLHVPSAEIVNIIQKVYTALKSNGIFYMSVKKGTFEGMRNGRYFTDYTKQQLTQLLTKFPLELLCFWESDDVRPGRDDVWLNILVKRV